VKFAALAPGDFSDPIRIASNWRLLIALGFYGLAFLFYAAAVSRLPLNVAHPVSTAGAIVLVGLASAIIFREPFSVGTGLGYALVFAGIAVLAMSGQR
jgi:multidrug transporter EmrE-like cation transporter